MLAVQMHATPLKPIQGSFQQYFAFGLIAFVLGVVLQTCYGQYRCQGDKSGTRTSQPVSRNQSLLKTNIAPQDLHSSDVLIERFVAWEAIVGQLIVYFEGIADIEKNTAKELTKLTAVIQVPFKSGNHFQDEGGLQDTYYGVRDKMHVIADQHASLGRTVDSSIIQHLQKLRIEINTHIKNIRNDTEKLATSVANERELSARYIEELASDISVFKNTSKAVMSKSDPCISNMAVMRQLQKQVNEENALQKSIIMTQQNSAHFEEGIVRAIQSAWQTFDEWQSRMSLSIQDTWRALGEHMAALAPDREWIGFSARSDHVLDPETPLRNQEHIEYPSKEDPSVIAVRTGHLERKKWFTRMYRESHFVLTPAGLHEYASSDPRSHSGASPMFSLFLPACSLGPPSLASSTSHEFYIEGMKIHLGINQHAWSFRARSREDMMEWWNDIKMFCARYLVTSEQMESSESVAAAVRAVGYVSEDEDDDDDDQESSVEDDDSYYSR